MFHGTASMDSLEDGASMADFSFSLLNFRITIGSTVRDSGVYPLRVIDLKKTFDSEGGIVFCAPTRDWNFHTVSHTWSQEIRKFSQEVGEGVLRQGEGSRYEDVFRQTKLEDRRGYALLLDFLKIVQRDGVERIWFDALCINQIDEAEKRREIAFMGAFYYHSLGCYVVAHGFGQGFQLLKSNGELPRWFTRVWTLQEFLLPTRLTYIVELATEEFHVVVRSVRNGHKRGGCNCKGKTESALWLWRSESGDYFSEFSNNPPPVQGEDEKEFWRQLESSGYRCTQGRFQLAVADQSCSTSLQLPASVQGGRGVMYFVERDAYAYIVMLLGGDLLMRFELLAYSGQSDGVVREISVRDCSNEEDRILAVLALLRLDGEMTQLRTGQTLAEQMVQMFSVMAKCNPQGLIKLCAAFKGPLLGNAMESLSWAPHFIVPNPPPQYQNVDIPMKLPTHIYVANMNVGSRGLSLSCQVVKGRLIPSLQHGHQCTKDGWCTAERSTPGEDRSIPRFVLQIANGHELCFNVYTRNEELALWREVEHKHIVMFEGYMVLSLNSKLHWDKCLLNRIEFNVWLLLLGSYEDLFSGHPDDQVVDVIMYRLVLVFMVCVGEGTDNLHKIGILHILPTYTNSNSGSRSTLHLDSFETKDCRVGGFRKREYNTWFMNQLHASCRWNFT